MKKKILTLILSSFSVILIMAQVSSSGKYQSFIETNSNDTVIVFIFSHIDQSTSITYDGAGSSVNWYKYNDLNNPVSNQSYLSPDNATGYVLNVDGKKTNIWVVDYSVLNPVFRSLTPENNPSNQCTQLNLSVDATIPPLSYQSPSGNIYTIPRSFTLTYTTLVWQGSAWQSKDTTTTVTAPLQNITVDAPLCSTVFTLSGDQLASNLGVPPFSIQSAEYQAVAVASHLTTAVTARTETNEAMRPSSNQPINYSGPIDVQFQSNANEPVAKYYKWEIYKGNALIISRTDKDHRYTFSEAGNYTVKLTVSNDYCSTSDSVDVTVSESAIYAPNVFTPNGDGFDDEFRVAYKSIISFECWILNRWGRVVYHWTDPQKGWDGTINGVKAAEGAYFYIIKAKGSDYDPNSKPNSKTHLRLGEYLLKGDINLLR